MPKFRQTVFNHFEKSNIADFSRVCLNSIIEMSSSYVINNKNLETFNKEDYLNSIKSGINTIHLFKDEERASFYTELYGIDKDHLNTFIENEKLTNGNQKRNHAENINILITNLLLDYTSEISSRISDKTTAQEISDVIESIDKSLATDYKPSIENQKPTRNKFKNK